MAVNWNLKAGLTARANRIFRPRRACLPLAPRGLNKDSADGSKSRLYRVRTPGTSAPELYSSGGQYGGRPGPASGPCRCPWLSNRIVRAAKALRGGASPPALSNRNRGRVRAAAAMGPKSWPTHVKRSGFPASAVFPRRSAMPLRRLRRFRPARAFSFPPKIRQPAPCAAFRFRCVQRRRLAALPS